MARNAGVVIENNFVRGLVTENTALNFPKNACTEGLDCVFDETGRVTRRNGIDLEVNDPDATDSTHIHLGSSVTYSSNAAFSEYVWRAADVALLVQQYGDKLYFHNISSDTSITANRVLDSGGTVVTIDLDTYQSTDNTLSPGSYQCSYATGNGVLIVVNPQCDPFYCIFDEETGSVTAAAIEIRYRDFEGIDLSGYATDDDAAVYFTEDYRPSLGDFDSAQATVLLEAFTDANSVGQQYIYNLYNQGWDVGNYNTTTARPDVGHALYDFSVYDSGLPGTAWPDPLLPNSYDYVGYYRASATDAFDSARLLTYRQGTSTAPKGHFVLGLGSQDRYNEMLAQSELTASSFTITNVIPVQITATAGTNFTSATAAWRDGDSSQTYAQSSKRTADTAYAGYSVTDKVAYSATVKAPSDYSMFTYLEDNSYWVYYDGQWSYVEDIVRKNSSGTVRLYGSNVGLNNATKTLLGSASISGAGATRTIYSSDTSTQWDYIWVEFDGVAASETIAVAECTIYERTTSTSSGGFPNPDTFTQRPTAVAFFAGRAWYAGANYKGFANNLYFSQIVIDDNTKYGRCYQRNDPTSEYLPDLLPNDGGVIKIPEMADCKALYAMENALVVYASNGVWIIRGSNRDNFTATDYVVRKLSSIGLTSAKSVVDVGGFPMWWGENGIFRLEYNPQFDSFNVNNVTDETIRTEYVNIPPFSRTFAKGAYDSDDSVVYWLFHRPTYDVNGDPEDVQDYRFFTHVLCYNTLSRAFYIWTLGQLTESAASTTSLEIGTGSKAFTVAAGLDFTANDRVKIVSDSDPESYAMYGYVASYSTTTLTITVERVVGSGTFADWTISAYNTCNVAGISYAVDSVGISPSRIKYTTLLDFDGAGTFYLVYADHFSNFDYAQNPVVLSYKDWTQHSIASGFAGDKIDFESYFITGYMPAGETMKFFQSPYVMVFLEYRSDAGGYIQGHWDYANVESSGKWSTVQSIFNSAVTTKAVTARRLKMRGKGRSLQIKISSESGKGFVIIGWSMNLMGNTEL